MTVKDVHQTLACRTVPPRFSAKVPSPTVLLPKDLDELLMHFFSASCHIGISQPPVYMA